MVPSILPSLRPPICPSIHPIFPSIPRCFSPSFVLCPSFHFSIHPSISIPSILPFICPSSHPLIFHIYYHPQFYLSFFNGSLCPPILSSSFIHPSIRPTIFPFIPLCFPPSSIPPFFHPSIPNPSTYPSIQYPSATNLLWPNDKGKTNLHNIQL